MQSDWLVRTQLLLGEEKLAFLKNKNVLVVGLGGVGGAAADMICRAGIGNMTIVDGDVIEVSNINRQLPALHSTVGMKKAHVMAHRLKDLNPDLNLEVIDQYLVDETMKELAAREFDYIVDAIDTLTPKFQLVTAALACNRKIVSSMGAGGRLNPAFIRVADISQTHDDNLARALRKMLHKVNIHKGFKAVFSSEKVIEGSIVEQMGVNKRSTVGTISYMPPIFGCFCASVVVQDLVKGFAD